MSIQRILYTGTRAPAATELANVLHLPMLAIKPRPVDESAVRDFVGHGSTIVFYSANAVGAVAETTRLLHDAPAGASFWAVGKKTAEALAEFGIDAQCPSDQRFEGVVAELPSGRHVSMELEGGERALAEHRPNDTVLTVICYASVEQVNDGDPLWYEAAPDWVVFTSPRGFETFLAHAQSPRFLEESRLAAIGPTTAEAMTERGHTPHYVPREPDAAHLIEELLSFDAPTR